MGKYGYIECDFVKKMSRFMTKKISFMKLTIIDVKFDVPVFHKVPVFDVQAKYKRHQRKSEFCRGPHSGHEKDGRFNRPDLELRQLLQRPEVFS